MNSSESIVLSIDATSPSLLGVKTTCRGSNIRVVESARVDATDWWHSHFAQTSTLDYSRDEDLDTSGNEENGGSAGSLEASSPEIEHVSSSPREGLPFSAPLRSLQEAFQGPPPDEVVIVLPPLHSLSLYLELPFSNKKSLARIAPLEAQDKVPFDLTPFHCFAEPIRKMGNETFGIHVDLFPRRVIENVLNGCKQLRLDPAIITTPSGLGELCYSLYPNYLAPDSVIVFPTALGFCCTFLIEGTTAHYLTLPQYKSDFDVSSSLASRDCFLAQAVNIAIAKTERQFGVSISKIYFIGNEDQFSNWEESALSRPVELLSFDSLLPGGDAASGKDSGFGTLASTAFMEERQEHRTQVTTTPNYRSGSFSYRPQFRILREGLRPLIHPALIFLLIALLLLPIFYIVTELRIAHLKTKLHDSIQALVPDQTVQKGEELQFLEKELQSSQVLLQQLGTGTGPDAQKELALLLEELAGSSNGSGQPTLQRINIQPERTTVEGAASSYQEAERLESLYRGKESRYCQVKLDTSGPRGPNGQQNFELDLVKVCE
ncbi:MAG: hypothetical protein KDD60_00730 [Bdellovibrionales bacterium]|nr:hypothetical protein [Bdellovibrionales bacterium]